MMQRPVEVERLHTQKKARILTSRLADAVRQLVRLQVIRLEPLAVLHEARHDLREAHAGGFGINSIAHRLAGLAQTLCLERSLRVGQGRRDKLVGEMLGFTKQIEDAVLLLANTEILGLGVSLDRALGKRCDRSKRVSTQ